MQGTQSPLISKVPLTLRIFCSTLKVLELSQTTKGNKNFKTQSSSYGFPLGYIQFNKGKVIYLEDLLCISKRQTFTLSSSPGLGTIMSLTFQTFLLDGGEFPNNHYGQAEVRGKQEVKYHRLQGHITSEAKTTIGIQVLWLITSLPSRLAWLFCCLRRLLVSDVHRS